MAEVIADTDREVEEVEPPMSYAKACEIVDARADGRCERCGRAALVANHHHRLLRSRGGRDLPSNLVRLCGSGTTGCHGWVHANVAAATDAGYIVRTNADPATVRLEHSRYAEVFLADDGEVYGIHPAFRTERMRRARLGVGGWPRITTHEGIRA